MKKIIKVVSLAIVLAVAAGLIASCEAQPSGKYVYENFAASGEAWDNLSQKEKDDTKEMFEKIFKETELNFENGKVTVKNGEETETYNFKMDGKKIILTDEEDEANYEEGEIKFEMGKVIITVDNEKSGALTITFKKK